MIYGYCRISTAKQNLERQHRNIKSVFPEAVIITEVYTGTKQNRPEWQKLLKGVKQGDTIVFDSVSRMSRNAEEGFILYEELFNKGVDLIFLKERHIDTQTYKNALKSGLSMTGTNVDFILEGINRYLLALAREQIIIAFEQAEKEVTDLRQRTKEGIETARLNGKQIGRTKGSQIVTKKSVKIKEEIVKYSRDFSGSLSDTDCIKFLGVCRNSFYKYKRELRETGT